MRILIADDAAPLRAVFGRIVRALGHEVVGEATDSPALLTLAAESAPDAVVLDGRLPPAGALAVIPALRAALPQAAIYVIAALAETALVRDAVAAGASGAIARPFLSESVAASLRGDPPFA